MDGLFQTLNAETIFGVAGIGATIIVFLIQLLKSKLNLPKPAVPFVAFGLGAALGAIAFYLPILPELTLMQAIVSGVIVGGSSTGLYDLSKITKLLNG